MTLGEKLETLRKERGMSRPAMAEALGVAYVSYYVWETNGRDPHISGIELLADYFNVSVDWLLCRTDNREIIGQRATDGKTLGKRLAMKMKQLNIKRYVLAEELDTREQMITFWKKDVFSPRAYNLTNLADILGVSADWLLGRSDKE